MRNARRLIIHPSKTWVYITLIFGIVFFEGCTNKAAETAVPTRTPIPITAYQSPTPSAQPAEETIPLDGTPTPVATATATPFLYAIESGDTLLEVAHHYDISLEQLLVANPGIDPGFLIVGTEIVIPIGDSVLSAYPLPTPVTFDLGKPQCYPATGGGLWCLALAQNSRAQALENLSASITIYAADGTELAQQLAVSSLNLLRPGQQIPLAAFFSSSFPEGITPQAKLISALPVDENSVRYIEIEIQTDEIQIDALKAYVRGVIRVPGGENAPSANRIWLAVSAFDENDVPVGIRKWEAASPAAAGTELIFEITVYSLGPAISKVQVLGEARPVEK